MTGHPLRHLPHPQPQEKNPIIIVDAVENPLLTVETNSIMNLLVMVITETTIETLITHSMHPTITIPLLHLLLLITDPIHAIITAEGHLLITDTLLVHPEEDPCLMMKSTEEDGSDSFIIH